MSHDLLVEVAYSLHLSFKEIYGVQSGEFVCLYCGLKVERRPNGEEFQHTT